MLLLPGDRTQMSSPVLLVLVVVLLLTLVSSGGLVAQAAPPTYLFMDAVNGLDSNSGLSAAQPLRTLDALMAKIALAVESLCVVEFTAGVYSVTSRLSISGTSSFTGAVHSNGSPATIFEGTNVADDGFTISKSTSMRNIVLRNMKTSSVDGGAVGTSGSVDLSFFNCHFLNNKAFSGYSGGGIYLATTSSLTMEDCTIHENTAAVDGGFLQASLPHTIIFRRCKFEGNHVSGVGHVMNILSNDASNSILRIEESTFTKNNHPDDKMIGQEVIKVDTAGGPHSTSTGFQLEISSSRFLEHALSGAFLLADAPFSSRIRDCWFEKIVAFEVLRTLPMDIVVFTGNVFVDCEANSASMVQIGCTFTPTVMQIEESSFVRNRLTFGPGEAALSVFGDATVSKMCFIGNLGAALRFSSATPTVTISDITLLDNRLPDSFSVYAQIGNSFGDTSDAGFASITRQNIRLYEISCPPHSSDLIGGNLPPGYSCMDCISTGFRIADFGCHGGDEIAWGTATPSSAPIISSLETPDRVSLLANVQWPPLTEDAAEVTRGNLVIQYPSSLLIRSYSRRFLWARNSDPGGPSGGQTFVFPADPNPLAWSNILKGTPARLPDDFNDRQITLVGGAVAVSTGGCRPSQQTITFPVYKTLAAADPGPFLSLETFYLATYMEYEIAVNPKNIFLGGALTSVTGQLTLEGVLLVSNPYAGVGDIGQEIFYLNHVGEADDTSPSGLMLSPDNFPEQESVWIDYQFQPPSPFGDFQNPPPPARFLVYKNSGTCKVREDSTVLDFPDGLSMCGFSDHVRLAVNMPLAIAAEVVSQSSTRVWDVSNSPLRVITTVEDFVLGNNGIVFRPSGEIPEFPSGYNKPGVLLLAGKNGNGNEGRLLVAYDTSSSDLVFEDLLRDMCERKAGPCGGVPPLTAITCPTPTVCFVASSSNKFLKLEETDDDGFSLEVIDIPVDFGFDFVGCMNALACVLTKLDSHEMLYTADEGATWYRDGVIKNRGIAASPFCFWIIGSEGLGQLYEPVVPPAIEIPAELGQIELPPPDVNILSLPRSPTGFQMNLPIPRDIFPLSFVSAEVESAEPDLTFSTSRVFSSARLTFTGLEPNRRYRLQVRLVNNLGPGPLSAPIEFKTPPRKPAALTRVVPTPSGFTVSMSVLDSLGSDAYVALQYSTSPTFPIAGTKEVRLVPPVSGSGDPSTQGLGFVLPDLLQDTFYYVRVGVANSGGMSPLTASFQIPSIASPPQSPTISLGNGQVTVEIPAATSTGNVPLLGVAFRYAADPTFPTGGDATKTIPEVLPVAPTPATYNGTEVPEVPGDPEPVEDDGTDEIPEDDPPFPLDPQSYPDSNYASPRPRVSGFRRFQLLQSTTVTLSTNVLGSGTSYFSVASINAGGVGSWSAATMVVVPDFSATTVVYVSPGGSDASSTGSQENPFLTLERAIQYIDDQVQTLGAILLQPGVYNVGSGFTISARQISIRPADSSDGTPGNHIIKCVSGSATSSPLFTVSGSGALSLQALVIQDCEKSTNGAVLSVSTSPTPTNMWNIATNCVFLRNKAPSGAVISIESAGHFSFTGCLMEANMATSGGGGVAFLSHADAKVQFRQSNVIANRAVTQGSAVDCSAGGLDMLGSRVLLNVVQSATAAGGALYLPATCSLEISNSEFQNNIQGMDFTATASYRTRNVALPAGTSWPHAEFTSSVFFEVVCPPGTGNSTSLQQWPIPGVSCVQCPGAINVCDNIKSRVCVFSSDDTTETNCLGVIYADPPLLSPVETEFLTGSVNAAAGIAVASSISAAVGAKIAAATGSSVASAGVSMGGSLALAKAVQGIVKVGQYGGGLPAESRNMTNSIAWVNFGVGDIRRAASPECAISRDEQLPIGTNKNLTVGVNPSNTSSADRYWFSGVGSELHHLRSYGLHLPFPAEHEVYRKAKEMLKHVHLSLIRYQNGCTDGACSLDFMESVDEVTGVVQDGPMSIFLRNLVIFMIVFAIFWLTAFSAVAVFRYRLKNAIARELPSEELTQRMRIAGQVLIRGAFFGQQSAAEKDNNPVKDQVPVEVEMVEIQMPSLEGEGEERAVVSLGNSASTLSTSASGAWILSPVAEREFGEGSAAATSTVQTSSPSSTGDSIFGSGSSSGRLSLQFANGAGIVDSHSSEGDSWIVDSQSQDLFTEEDLKKETKTEGPGSTGKSSGEASALQSQKSLRNSKFFTMESKVNRALRIYVDIVSQCWSLFLALVMVAYNSLSMSSLLATFFVDDSYPRWMILLSVLVLVVFVVGLPALLFWLALFRRDPIFDAENVWHRRFSSVFSDLKKTFAIISFVLVLQILLETMNLVFLMCYPVLQVSLSIGLAFLVLLVVLIFQPFAKHNIFFFEVFNAIMYIIQLSLTLALIVVGHEHPSSRPLLIFLIVTFFVTTLVNGAPQVYAFLRVMWCLLKMLWNYLAKRCFPDGRPFWPKRTLVRPKVESQSCDVISSESVVAGTLTDGSDDDDDEDDGGPWSQWRAGGDDRGLDATLAHMYGSRSFQPTERRDAPSVVSAAGGNLQRWAVD